ncbi:SpaA isopeptide-forming pilin-related protein, partial [Ruminococcus intestinalis]|uniref:SpaA isopeptide-forming pilin-related protein n=1 Tax=Ruminococcus intestinalis TaxID=2763066 RepID=UPI003F7E81FD
GYLVTPETLPYGKGYAVVEVQAPYGYLLDSTPVYFVITAENTSEENGVTIVKTEKKNTPQKGTITVEKTGEIFSNVTAIGGGYTDENGNDVVLPTIYQPEYSVSGLSGAVFEIYADEDITTPDGTVRVKEDTLVDTVITGTNGKATSNEFYLGKYRVVEKTAPYGFVLNKTVNHIELTYSGQNEKVTNTLTSFTNDRQKVVIDLTKILEQDEKFNIGNNNEIFNVSFGLYADEDLKASNGTVIPKDGLIEIITCDEKGKATFTTDLPIGSYYVKEISTDNHYILSDKKYPVVFEYAGQDTATVHISVNDGEPIENEIIYGTIQGLKIDRETGENITGALFGMFKAEEKELSEKTAILTAESNEEGIFTFENVPYGEYIVYELKPATGYLPNVESYPVTISENKEVVEITVLNDKISELKTTAAIDGKKEFTINGDVTIDDVVSYKHLVPGKEYTVKGILMDKATGKPFLVDDKEITSEVTFTAEKANSEVIVSFTFDGSAITKNTEVVVFETLYREGTEIAVHADIDDKDQTVTIHPQPEPEKPQTGDNSNLGFFIGLGSVALGGLVAFLIIKFRKKDEDDE